MPFPLYILFSYEAMIRRLTLTVLSSVANASLIPFFVDFSTN